MHDCTGPFTLLAGLNMAAANTGVAFQETVRAHIATLYPALIDENVTIADGHITIPQRSGIGARWLPELFDAHILAIGVRVFEHHCDFSYLTSESGFVSGILTCQSIAIRSAYPSGLHAVYFLPIKDHHATPNAP